MTIYNVSTSPKLRRGYTLDDLENNEEFQDISERFLSSIGEQSDDVFEYLRDSDFNLFQGMQRAMDSGKFTEQQKQDYKYLRSTFDKADMGSLKQYVELFKDASVDIATDPTAIAAMLLTPVTGGTSVGARQAIATGANKGLKNIALGKKGITPLQTAGITAAEVGAWTGLDNHFRQQTEINTNMRKLYSNPELAGSAAIGALTGGIFGGLARKNEFFEDRLQRLYSEDGYRKEAGSDLVYKLRKKKDALLAKTLASPAWVLKTDAEFSPTARLLGQKFTSEFNKSLITRSKTRLGYSYAEDLQFRRGNYKAGYEAAIEPLYKAGRISPEAGEEVITILRGGNVPGASKAVQDTANNLRLYFDSVRKDANEIGLNVGEVENYFPRSWDREAIEANTPLFRKLLVDNDIVPEEEVDDVIKGMLNKQNELYSSHSALLTQARKFENLDDNTFKDFLSNDLHTVTTNYFMNAARTIEHKKHFLSKGSDVKIGGKTEAGNLLYFKQTNEQQFINRFIKPIEEELSEFGRTLSKKDKQNLIDVYKSVTGQVDYFTSEAAQALYDGTKLANAMAYLPLATVSSLSEAFITLGKAPVSSAVKGMQEGIENGGRILTTEMGQMLKEKHRMSDVEITKEMNSVFLAVDEAMADLTNRLSGEGLQNETLKKAARGFYRFNLLIPWTKTVQLAAFSTGKDLIQSNLKQLANPKGLSTAKISRLRGELNDLGVDIEKGLEWNKTFGDNINKAARESEFYKNDIVRGAGRFTNGVILQTGREFATVPLFMTNPKVDIFTQFLRYPTVFGNTVLRNFAKETITDTTANAPKLAAFVLMSTNVAKATNYWRATPEQREKMTEEDDWRDTLKAYQRVGLLGPTEYLLRGFEGMAYGQNPLVAGVGTGGPVINDLIGFTLYDRGLFETIARKLPLTGTKNIIDRNVGDIMEEYTGFREPYTPLQKIAKDIDKSIGGGFQTVANMVTGVEEDKAVIRPLELEKRTPFMIGGKVAKGLSTKLKPIYSRVDDEMGGGPKTVRDTLTEEEAKEYDKQLQEMMQSFYMDDYGNYSPTLKILTEEQAAQERTGPKLAKWLKQQRSNKGIKQKELDYLEVEEYIKNHPYQAGAEVAEGLSDRRLSIVPFVRTESGISNDLLFDEKTLSYDEAREFLTKKIDKDDTQYYPHNKFLTTYGFGKEFRIFSSKYDAHPDITVPLSKEDYEAYMPYEIIKADLSTFERQGTLVPPFDENAGIKLFAYGNPELGYKMFSNDIDPNIILEFEARNDLARNITEAKIAMQSLLQEEYIIPSSSNRAILKVAIDENSPGGTNYRNFVYNVKGPKVKELDILNMEKMHFKSFEELTQFGHAVTKDRKLKGKLDSLHIEELQSDYLTNVYDYGLSTKTNKEIAKKIEKENDIIDSNLTEKRILLDKLIKDLTKSRYGDDADFIDTDMLRDNIEKKPYTKAEEKLILNFQKDWNKTDDVNLDPLFSLDKQREGNVKKFGTEISEDIQNEFFSLDSKHQLRIFDEKNEPYYQNRMKEFKEKGKPYPNYLMDNYTQLSINGKFLEPREDLEIVDFLYLDSLKYRMGRLSDKLSEIKDKYANPYNLIPDNPIQEDWYKRIIDRILLEAVKENKDAISIAQSHIINQRYTGQGENTKRYLYDTLFPSYLKTLAKRYNTKVVKKEIDPKDISDEPFEYYDTYSSDLIDDTPPYDKKELFNVNTLIITPELRKKILKEGVKTFAKGGLVTGEDNVPFTKEDPADRVDPFTGSPYSDQMERIGFSLGGKALFEDRINNPDKYPYIRQDKELVTHRMAQSDNIAYPMVQLQPDGTLKDYGDDFELARKEAIKNNNIKVFKTEDEAIAYANNGYKTKEFNEYYNNERSRLGLQEGGNVNYVSNRNYIYNRFINDFGYRPEAVIGMLGNFAVESDNTFRHDIVQGELSGNPLVYTKEDIDKGVINKVTKKLKTEDDIGKPKKGYGIAQFDFMNDYYQDYLNHNSKKDSLDSQIEYINDVIQGTDTYANFKGKMLANDERKKLLESLNKDNVEGTTKSFMEIFEKPGTPHLDRRLNEAKRIVKELNLFKD